jgi:hypothetical protein
MTACGRGCKAYHGRHIARATAPVRAPALDGHAKAAPYTGPDDEPRKRPKWVHLCYPLLTPDDRGAGMLQGSARRPQSLLTHAGKRLRVAQYAPSMLLLIGFRLL